MPLLFDMPLEDLKIYKGVNPRPNDFDSYWDAALKEMAEVDPQIEIIPDEEFQTPFATCSHLWFTGVGGARIHAKLIQPKNAVEPHPAVLQFHGYFWDSGDWQALLHYVAAGFTVAALDCRGQGGLSEDIGGVKGRTMGGHITRGLEDAPEKLLFRSVFLDTAQLARIVMDMSDVDETRVGTMGQSQGGGLALACAALEPRIQRAVACFPYLSDYRRTWEKDLVDRIYADVKEYFRHRDPQHKREEDIFTRLGYIDVQHLVPRVRAEVLMASALSDRICLPSTQFAAYNKITSKKTMELYPDFGHEALPGFWDQAFLFMLDI